MMKGNSMNACLEQYGGSTYNLALSRLELRGEMPDFSSSKNFSRNQRNGKWGSANGENRIQFRVEMPSPVLTKAT